MRRVLFLLALAACGDGAANPTVVDAGAPGADAPPVGCVYEPLPANANAGGTVTAGPLQAGAAEARLDLPVGSALGAYTGRVAFLGFVPDARKWPWASAFAPSVGVETAPMAKAIALSAGGETIVIVKVDLGISNDGLTHDLAARLGLPGKVLLAASHTHSGPGHFTPNVAMALGFARFRRAQYDALLGVLERTARAALAARRPARLGVLVDNNFDPANEVSHDRRGANDVLAGGPRKDNTLFLLRIDGTDGEPIAVVDVFGVHGIVMGVDNPYASTDAIGAIERAMEESFDRKVVVMHLQGAAGDVSPSQGRGIDCTGRTRCLDFARSEKVGRAALPILEKAWRDAAPLMVDTLELEMLTRVIELGPKPETFTVRGGQLSYAPWDGTTPGDGRIFDEAGKVISPVDEFNAPFGAPLCGSGDLSSLFSGGQLPGVASLAPYKNCVALSEGVASVLGRFFDVDLGLLPICATTRTAVSAIRLGQNLLLALPGEPLTLYADRLRQLSPAPPERTIVVGYSQGHIGYLLTAEDWLQAGYEPSINFWGPLEGEAIAEQAIRLAGLALTPQREDGAAGGVPRWVTPPATDDRAVPPPDPAPLAGTVPTTLPADLYAPPLVSAQPPSEVKRMAVASFVWIDEDPLDGTPHPTLQRETPSGFVDVTRRSGRPVEDGDLLLGWTPVPLQRAAGEHATHHWVVSWQAVAWTGAPEERAGVALGRYRFRVGALTSQPFSVVAGEFALSATRDGTKLSLAADYTRAADGFRLVAPPGGQVTVVWSNASGAKLGEAEAEMSAAGTFTVDSPSTAQAASVTASDRFGNSASAAL